MAESPAIRFNTLLPSYATPVVRLDAAAHDRRVLTRRLLASERFSEASQPLLFTYVDDSGPVSDWLATTLGPPLLSERACQAISELTSPTPFEFLTADIHQSGQVERRYLFHSLGRPWHLLDARATEVMPTGLPRRFALVAVCADYELVTVPDGGRDFHVRADKAQQLVEQLTGVEIGTSVRVLSDRPTGQQSHGAP